MCEIEREPKGSALPVLARVLAAVAVAVVALAILAQGFAITGIFRAREQARRSKCLNNLKQLMLGLKQYAMDFREICPWCVGRSEPKDAWLDLTILYPNYNSSFQSFFCPSAKDEEFEPKCASGDKEDNPFEPIKPADNTEVISYAYCLDGSDPARKTAWTEEASSTVRLSADKKAGCAIEDDSEVNPTAMANHKDDGRNTVYLDGHVKWKAGPGALDPDEDDDDIGDPDADEYSDWWSDPPYYREGMKEETPASD